MSEYLLVRGLTELSLDFSMEKFSLNLIKVRDRILVFVRGIGCYAIVGYISN